MRGEVDLNRLNKQIPLAASHNSINDNDNAMQAAAVPGRVIRGDGGEGKKK